MPRRPTVAALLLAAVFACRGQGVVSLSFSLGGDLPEDLTGLYFHTEVRDPNGAVLGGAVGEASLDTPIRLSVAHGDGRIARLEIRDGASAETSAVVAYGISEPFDLVVGRTSRVDVAIPIRRVPRVTSISVTNAVGGAIATRSAALQVEADRANVVQAIIAQDPSLSFRRSTAPLQPDALAHDLTYDLELDCENTGGCGDGPRAIFVRLIDDAGYTSSSTSTTLTLDTTPPAVLGGSASVGFEAPGALVLPTAAGNGTTVRLTFTFNEVVTATPTVRLAESDLPFDYVANEFGAWIFERTVDANDPAGRQRPLVTGTDVAGNAEPFASPSLEYVVDDEPPAPPDVDDPSRIVYERAPWGTFDDPAPRYVVRGTVGTLEPGTRVVVYDDANALENGVERANRAGVGTAAADGSFEVALTPFDRPQVYILLVDPSGNLHDANGTAAKVRNTFLTIPAATEGAGPPTQVHRMDRLPRSLRRDAAGTIAETDAAGLAVEDGAGPRAEYVLRWSEISPAPSPLPDAVRLAGTAYDTARARTIVYGGRYGNEPREQTWEWDGKQWSTFVATGSEPVCNDGSVDGEEPFNRLGYHGRLRRSLLVCRRLVPDNPPPLPPDEVDELAIYGWNGERWSVVPVDPGTAPPSRSGHAVAYDETSGAMVVFGGNESSLAAAGQFGTGLSDTWSLEIGSSTAGPSLAWVEHTVANPPPARDRHGMVYTPGVGVVMFGGIASDRNRTVLDDLWVWDGQTWNEVPRTTPWPPARACHAMVHDPETGAVGVIGGVTAEPVQRCLAEPGLDDTWWWDGNGWTQTATAAGAPTGTGVVANTHGTTGDVIVLSGGALEAAPGASRTWRVSTTRWFDRTPTGARITAFSRGFNSFTQGVYHEAIDATLIHTSYVPLSNLSETWTWDDGGWRRLSIEPTIGDPRMMAYDPVRQEAVMFANPPNMGVAQYAHDGTAWRQVTAGAVAPRVFSLNSLVFDTSRQEVVILASQTLTGTVAEGGELLSWNGSRWSSFWLGAKPGGGGLVYEPTPNRFLTTDFDFETRLSTLWIYQAGAWTSQPSVTPWSQAGSSVRDPRRDKSYATGYVSLTADLWELVGTTYEPRSTVGPRPSRGSQVKSIYDARRRRIIAPVTSAFRPSPGNLNVLDVNPENRPAVTVRLDLARAAIRGRVVAVEVTATAGGRGFLSIGGAPQDGVDLVAWDHQRGGWRTLGANAVPTDSPARLTATTSDDDARSLVTAFEPTLDLAVVPTASLGAGHEPSVRLDRLAVRIGYRSE